MNILYISHTNYPGGATSALVSIVKGMINKGHKVYVVVNNHDGPLTFMLGETDATILRAPLSDTVYERKTSVIRWLKRMFFRICDWQKSGKLIRKYISDYNIDIVHTNVGPLNIALRQCKRVGVPHVWHHREYFDKCDGTSFFPNNEIFYKIIKEKGNYNICITKQIRDYLHLGENTPVIFDGVFNQSELNCKRVCAKENYILFVGRIEENKGVDSLLYVWNAFHRKHTDYKLKIAGSIDSSSSYYKRCISIISSNNISDSVELLGHRTDVYALMASAKALVVTSLYEGFGFITVEGMLNKTLTICRNTSGTKEQLDNGHIWTGGEIGLRFNNNDELLECLYKAVEEDCSDYIMRATQAISHYTTEENIERIESYYRQIVAKNIS